MTNRLLISLAVLLILLFTATIAAAEVINIDGSDADWTSITIDTINDDPIGDVVDPPADYNYAYDIDWNYFEWDVANNNLAFAFYTEEDLGSTAGHFAEIFLNTDKDSTGGTWRSVPGLEYYMTWDMDGTDWELWEWTTSWSQVSSPDMSAAKGSDFVEWAVDADEVGYPATFYWGAYLDNAGVWSDDYCPDDYEQEGFIPEPGTMALMSLGLVGFAAWRRRRDES